MGISREPSPSLIDMNSGILSLSADGVARWPRTLRLARSAREDDVARVIAVTELSCMKVMQRRMPQLRGLLTQHQIELKVTPAIELSLHNDLFDQAVYVSTVMGGLHRKYHFLRVPQESFLPIAPVVRTLRSMNLTPILLAPERCPRFQQDDAELRSIVACGGLIQLSASSLLDQSNGCRVRLCRRLLRQRCAHFVASESGRHHDIPISLAEAHRLIIHWEGQSLADQLCAINPAKLIEMESVQTPKRQSRLSFLRRAA